MAVQNSCRANAYLPSLGRELQPKHLMSSVTLTQPASRSIIASYSITKVNGSVATASAELAHKAHKAQPDHKVP